MNKNNKYLNLLLQFIFSIMIIKSSFAADNKFTHPFYIGVTGGFGSTTWAGLVPTEENKSKPSEENPQNDPNDNKDDNKDKDDKSILYFF